jgi:hypothetical protein
VNGKHQHTVSLEEQPGVLSCILNFMSRSTNKTDRNELEEKFHMSFGGIDNSTNDYVDWSSLEIGIGDRIELEILKDSISVPPASRRPYEREDHCKDSPTKQKEGEQDVGERRR